MILTWVGWGVIICADMWRILLFCFTVLLCACVGRASVQWPDDFMRRDIRVRDYVVATWGHADRDGAPVYIYIEGDGNAFDGRGYPTDNPTPRASMLREMAMRDSHENVVYMARPCQFVMSDACRAANWTSGRFARHLVDVMAAAVRDVAAGRPVVLIGYSGGALMSGLIISQYPDIVVQKWITIAGVLNHDDWTDYFGDSPLNNSENMNELPHVSQVHYVAEHDNTVPIELTRRWVGDENIIIVPGARHGNFGNWVPEM